MSDAGALTGQIAVVTGGSRGIGLAVARGLAEDGAAVAVLGRNGEKAAAAAQELPGSGHGGYPCDVGDPDACKAVIKQISDDMGVPTILVNNAGITRDNILMRMKDDEWSDVITTNLGGAFNMTRAVTKGMMKKREGVILNISSVIGLMGNPGQANYAAAKAGIHGLTKTVAKELASRGIRCNCIAPGYIQTDMTSGLEEEQREALQERIPLGRLGEPGDIADVVRFLVGPGARYITGQILSVDGGMVI